VLGNGTSRAQNRLAEGEMRRMAFEYPTRTGVVRLLKAGCRWGIEFNGRRHAQWTSPDAAVMAAFHHRTGLAEWDGAQLVVSDDLLRWRPIGDNL